MRTSIATGAALAALLVAAPVSLAASLSSGPQTKTSHAARTTRRHSARHATVADVAATASQLVSTLSGSSTQPAAVGTPTTSGASSSSTTSPVLGTFDITTTQQLSQWKSAGGTAVDIPIFWQAAQPTAGGPVSLTSASTSNSNALALIQAAHADGLQVFIELDLQYAPSWVLNSVPEYEDQGGNLWTSSTAGANVRDWVWSAVGRQDVASFVSGAMSALKPYLADINGIRSGGGMYGELGYPQNGSTVNGEPSFWGYDAAAQTGSGLAAGESATPLPGYVYGTGTAAQDTAWANWYLGSLASWIKWYTQTLRADGWTGPTYVLSPSFGMRTNMAPRTAAYEQQLAYGTDWGVMMNAYDQVPNVWPWSDWADDTEPYWTTGDTVDSDAAAWRKLMELAQQRGLTAHIMGENTGGGGASAIHQMMSGALADGYTGMFYMDYPALMLQGLEPYLVSQFNTYAHAG